MAKALNRLKGLWTSAKRLAFSRKEQIMFVGHELTLDTGWKHERSYYEYIRSSKITGPLAMDVWAFSHFVKPGAVVLDAGANIGFTALLAERAGAKEIHCFEPDPRLTRKLKTHCRGEKFIVYELALGENPESLPLCLSTQHNQGSTLSKDMVKKFPRVFGEARNVQVEVDSIDNLFGDKGFDVWKIDVEGAEFATLKGAASILSSCPPDIICVELYEEFFDQVHDLLKSYYGFTYRVVCDHIGRGRLYTLDADISDMEQKGLHISPPFYVYALNDQEKLAQGWTPSAISSDPV